MSGYRRGVGVESVLLCAIWPIARANIAQMILLARGCSLKSEVSKPVIMVFAFVCLWRHLCPHQQVVIFALLPIAETEADSHRGICIRGLLQGELVPGSFSRFYGDSVPAAAGGAPIALPPAQSPSDGTPGDSAIRGL